MSIRLEQDVLQDSVWWGESFGEGREQGQGHGHPRDSPSVAPFPRVWAGSVLSSTREEMGPLVKSLRKQPRLPQSSWGSRQHRAAPQALIPHRRRGRDTERGQWHFWRPPPARMGPAFLPGVDGAWDCTSLKGTELGRGVIRFMPETLWERLTPDRFFPISPFFRKSPPNTELSLCFCPEGNGSPRSPQQRRTLTEPGCCIRAPLCSTTIPAAWEDAGQGRGHGSRWLRWHGVRPGHRGCSAQFQSWAFDELYHIAPFYDVHHNEHVWVMCQRKGIISLGPEDQSSHNLQLCSPHGRKLGSFLRLWSVLSPFLASGREGLMPARLSKDRTSTGLHFTSVQSPCIDRVAGSLGLPVLVTWWTSYDPAPLRGCSGLLSALPLLCVLLRGRVWLGLLQIWLSVHRSLGLVHALVSSLTSVQTMLVLHVSLG